MKERLKNLYQNGEITAAGLLSAVANGWLTVHKSDHENTGADGEGIKFAAAKAAGFSQTETGVDESPAI